MAKSTNKSSKRGSKRTGDHKMAVFTKPNKFTYAIKAECAETFIKSKNTKQENEWIKDKAQAFKENNLRITDKEEQ